MSHSFRGHTYISVNTSVNVPTRFAKVILFTPQEYSNLITEEDRKKFAPLTEKHLCYLKYFPQFKEEEFKKL